MKLFNWAELDSIPHPELVDIIKSYDGYIKDLEASNRRLQKASATVSCVIDTTKEAHTLLNVKHVYPTRDGLVIQVELP